MHLCGDSKESLVPVCTISTYLPAFECVDSSSRMYISEVTIMVHRVVVEQR